MLWDYSRSTNNHSKVQFLLPLDPEPIMGENNLALVQDDYITEQDKQAFQRLFGEFLTQLGYTVDKAENQTASAQPFALNAINPTTIDELIGVMHSFAFCTALRQHSTQPLRLLNDLITNLHEIADCRTYCP
jgi:CheY-like chemotaxis protein